jgi:allantoate deiminase
MRLRRDALAAAAEAITAIERRCGEQDGLVGTVGRIAIAPGAVNVIPGSARFTLDLRAAEDGDRRAALADVLGRIEAICARRGLSLRATPTHDHRSTACAPWLMTQVEQAIAAQGVPPTFLPSGAGHDAMALADLADVGMLFVRCRGGVSHNPAEAVAIEDVELGARALLHLIRHFTPGPRRRQSEASASP